MFSKDSIFFAGPCALICSEGPPLFVLNQHIIWTHLKDFCRSVSFHFFSFSTTNVLQIALVTKVAKRFAPKKEIWKKKLLAVRFHQFFVRLD